MNMATKPRGLGRGLDALLGGAEDTAPARKPGDAPATLALDSLQPGRYQPRTRMDAESLSELAASIKAQGIMQPILVRPVGAGKHEIIAGERRWRAARLAGLTEVPVLVREVGDNAALAMALIENIQREDLNPLEEANGIQRLVQEFGMTHDSAAVAVGRSRSAVSNLLRLLGLAPAVRELLEQGQLDMGHARALLALAGAQQVETARAVAAKGLSVRETEALVARLLRGAGTARKTQKPDRDVARLAEDLSEKLGTRVTLQTGRKGSGKLTIVYRDLDQLEALLARLRA
jgi:ParB family chromosome partitioning protein